MKKRTIAWLVAAIVLVLVGGILFACAMTAMGWNFARLNTVEYETNTHEIREAFEDISIETSTADVLFVLSDDDVCKIVCREPKDDTHAVSVENGTLTISQGENRQPIRINFTSAGTKITVYLPKAEYDSLFVKASTGDINVAKDLTFRTIEVQVTTGDVICSASASEAISVRTTTGDITMKGVSAESIALKVSSGKITANDIVCKSALHITVGTGDSYLTNVTCDKLSSDGNTGDISLKNVTAEKEFSITRSTGDVWFDRCDGGEIFVETSTGTIEGTLRSEKDFSACRANTGTVRVPKTQSGGKCELVTNTGDIHVEIKK